jgi:hypothetical protein
MKLNFQEFERGTEEVLEKEAFLGKFYDSTYGAAGRFLGRRWDEAKQTVNNLPGIKQYNQVNKGLNYVTGGGLMNDIGTVATSAIPLLGMMGGGAKAPGAGGAAPNININLGGNSNPLGITPGAVKSFNSLSTQGIKTGGLLDLGLLRTVLTARTANDMIDSVQTDKDGKPIAQPTLPPQNKKTVELTTKYPDIEKILADPQSRAYLESLLTNKTSYGA